MIFYIFPHASLYALCIHIYNNVGINPICYALHWMLVDFGGNLFVNKFLVYGIWSMCGAPLCDQLCVGDVRPYGRSFAMKKVVGS